MKLTLTYYYKSSCPASVLGLGLHEATFRSFVGVPYIAFTKPLGASLKRSSPKPPVGKSLVLWGFLIDRLRRASVSFTIVMQCMGGQPRIDYISMVVNAKTLCLYIYFLKLCANAYYLFSLLVGTCYS